MMKTVKIEEEYYYSEDYVDYFLKINYALTERFKKQLNDEFGTEIEDVIEMFKILYEEGNKLRPKKWYEYAMGTKETSN